MESVGIGIFCLIAVVSSQYYEGDSCTLLYSEEQGTCLSLNSCNYAKKILTTNGNPQHCGFHGLVPIVCCPSTIKIVAPGQKSREQCETYHPNLKGPKTDAKFIVIGQKSLAKEFPHMAAVGFGNENNIQWLCGGSLISDQFILTAAHCLFSQEYGEAKWVRLGELDLKNTTDDADPKDFIIVEKIPHPQFRPPSQYNDIALLKINGPVEYTAYIQPICLYTKTELPPLAIATGWGKTEFSGEASSHLLKVDLKYIDHEECLKNFNSVSNRRLPNGIRKESQLCAGNSGGKDTCNGDSGGPLQSQLTEQTVYYSLTGITSFGKACGIAGTPGVYTRVSHYISWIEKHVWPN